MDNRLLLVKVISLIYLEALYPETAGRSSELIKEIIGSIKPPEGMLVNDFSKDTVTALRTTAMWMASNPSDYAYNNSDLLQRLRMDTHGDSTAFDAISLYVKIDTSAMTKEVAEKCIAAIRDSLRQHLNYINILNIIKPKYMELAFKPETIDFNVFVKELLAELDPYASLYNSEKPHPGMIAEVNFSNKQSVNDILQQANDELDCNGIIRFGNQGINRMFGDHGGGRRGEFILFSALQHNYKSGMVLNLIRQAAVYNKPYLKDPAKKPLLLRMSFENPATLDVAYVYKIMMEQETGEMVDIRTKTSEEMSDYVMNALTHNGYHVIFTHVDPTDFTFHDLFDYINKLEAQGYEIHLLELDYLNMMSKKGCTHGPHGYEVRDLFRRVRNFTSRKGILCITPHQLSTQAKELVRQGAENFVQEIANKGYYDSCKTIDQEVDMEIYIHLVKLNGDTYLTIQRGKHRKFSITPEKDLYCVYKFNPIGGIPDDINGPDMSRKRVGASTAAEGGQLAWHDNI